MMNKANVLKVCDALESGKYEQGTHALCADGEYCCLGVACDVSGLGDWSDDDTYLEYRINLPPVVMEWLGFDDNCGPAVCGCPSSASANDKGELFPAIAAGWRKLVAKEQRQS